MGTDTTPRDRVWIALMNVPDTFGVPDVRDEMMDSDGDGVPSENTIHRVLKAASEEGLLVHQHGSTEYEKSAAWNRGGVDE